MKQKAIWSMVIVIALVGSGLIGALAIVAPNARAAAHLPIRIDSNADFAAVATGGNGTIWSPWVIDNYEINGSGAGFCIYIGNTTDYFVIRNCSLNGASGVGSTPYYVDSGLILYSVSNGVIENNTIFGNVLYGIYLTTGTNSNSVTGNTIAENGDYGAISESSSLNVIVGNNFIGNNLGGAQASSDTNDNIWNGTYPSGGNFWSDLYKPDTKNGAIQNLIGSDGFVDVPYPIAGGLAWDSYPLVCPSTAIGMGGIQITDPDDGNYISGTIIVKATVTAYNNTGVLFYIDGVPKFFDVGAIEARFILDTTTLIEDSTITITAVAYLNNEPAMSSSVRVIVNNIAIIADYITVNTQMASYHPDQSVSVNITTKNSPPEFESLDIVINYTDPDSNTFTRYIRFQPSVSQYMVTMPLTSDAPLGNYTITVWAQGFMNKSLVWEAKNQTIFTVSGKNIYDMLEDIELTLSSINATLNTVQVMVNGLQNDLAGANASIMARIAASESSILLRIQGMNASLAAQITSEIDAISVQIIGMNSSVSAQMTALQGQVASDNSSLRAWLDLTMAAIKNALDTANATLHSQLSDIQSNDTSMAAKLDALNQTLTALAKLDTIIRDVGALDTSIQAARQQLDNSIKDSGDAQSAKMDTNTMLLMIIIILVIVAMVISIVMGRKAKPTARPPEPSKPETQQ